MKVEIGPYVDNEQDERVMSVSLDDYDMWNLDHTLALIILPALKTYKEENYGIPWIDNEDVPEELRTTPDGDEISNDHHYTVEKHHYVLDEMIFAFSAHVDDDCDKQFWENGYDREGDLAFWARVDNGMRLFGKYYRTLWS